jgi:SAM-dependent methyltransferase
MSLKEYLKSILLSSDLGYSFFLRSKGLMGEREKPVAPWSNEPLLCESDYKKAIDIANGLRLPLHNDLPKNWDSLAALDVILSNTNKDARILDAGAELYSTILQWLYLYGYRRLIGNNLVFKKPLQRGSIRFETGDITKTHFDNESFDAVTCLSVIEHGVDLVTFFSEMKRIIKPNGILFISTDYYEQEIDTSDKFSYGVPIKVFSEDEIRNLIRIAEKEGFKPIKEQSYKVNEKPIHWKSQNLWFTFINVCLRRED